MSGSDENTQKDRALREAIARGIVPPGLRPTNPADVEALLDAAGGNPFSDEQVSRILAKAKGKLPLGDRDAEEVSASAAPAPAEAEQELLALHRGEGGELSAEVRKKLDRLRKQARDSQQRERKDEIR